jgi:hypothetical protein
MGWLAPLSAARQDDGRLSLVELSSGRPMVRAKAANRLGVVQRFLDTGEPLTGDEPARLGCSWQMRASRFTFRVVQAPADQSLTS